MSRARRIRVFLATATWFAAVACVDLTDDQAATTLWEAQLDPAPAYPGLEGQAAAVSDRFGTAVGIGIRGDTAGAEHLWALRVGTCGAPGDQIGLSAGYPLLVATDSGTASAEAQLGGRLVASGSYHVAVAAGATDTTRIACGDLALRP